jgi:hypothetical protein
MMALWMMMGMVVMFHIVSKVATKTKIIGIDVFRKVRSQGKWVSTAYDSDILAGINWAVNNAQTYNIKAVNLSLGVPGVKYTSECSDSSYGTAFANARAAGVVPVVASGNDAFLMEFHLLPVLLGQ